jgi:hypothetical protein
MSRPIHIAVAGEGSGLTRSPRFVQLRLPLWNEQRVVDVTVTATSQLDELARRHLKYHDQVVDQRIKDFFDELDRRAAEKAATTGAAEGAAPAMNRA